MRLGAIYNVVFNRKRKVLAPDETALVQIEILLVDRSKKYVGTGIYLPSGQFDQKTRQIIGCSMAGRYNARIGEVIADLRRHELSIIDSGRWMTSSDLDAFFSRDPGSASFVGFIKDQAKQRKDITVTTRDRHVLVADMLKKVGIVQFADLTMDKIQAFDNFLRGQGKEQTTISKKHQVVKTYIHRAERQGLIPYGANPYLKISIPRGKHKIRTRLDADEMEKILTAVIDVPVLDACRDIYAFQIFTGVSYKDLRILTWSEHIRRNGEDWWLEGLRKKTGEYYSPYLVPEAVALIEKYRGVHGDFLFPAPLIWTQNRNLKLVAVACGISKRLTTHSARHTAATQMLRSGVSLPVIRDVLGHSSTKTTEIYARMERELIKKEMLRARPGRS